MNVSKIVKFGMYICNNNKEYEGYSLGLLLWHKAIGRVVAAFCLSLD